MMYHGIEREKASTIELNLEHLAMHPCEHNLSVLEDSILDIIPKVEGTEKMYWWKTYYSGLIIMKCKEGEHGTV